MNSIAGHHVLVTRPTEQARRQQELITRAGGIPISLPLLDIVGPGDPATVAAQLRLPTDLRLFTSVNAVRWAANLNPSSWDGHLFASGVGTADQLRQHVDRPIITPQQAGAAGLLELPELQRLEGKRALIVCGVDPLPDLARGLRERHADVHLAEVYRRVVVDHPAALVHDALGRADAAIVTSMMALDHLVAITPESLRPRLFDLHLVVPSGRLSEHAAALGFFHPVRPPDEASDEAWVRALVS